MPQKKIRTCKTCAERFEAKRSDAKFCCDLHRC